MTVSYLSALCGKYSYTCHTTRAVFIDLARSLSTNSFLLSLRRFIGIYGKPREIYSGNGTNFVGAERVLREEIDQLNNSTGLNQFVKRENIV